MELVEPSVGPQTARGFFDLTKEGVIEWIASLGEPKYRADQVLRWVYQDFESEVLMLR